MDIILEPLLWLLSTAIELYIWVILIGVVLSWLLVFNVVNRHHRVVYMIKDFSDRLTEPALRPIRRIVPLLGNVDLSPLILILLLLFAQRVLGHLYSIVV
jgi:YggT family protein